MNFYYKALGESGYIEVFHDSKLLLRVKQANYLRSFYTFYKDGVVIFKSRLTHFGFWGKVEILEQDLAEPIESINIVGWKETELFYDNVVLSIIKNGLFKKKMWLLHKNGFEVGYIEWAKFISVGGEYNFYINDDDETVNIYFLILFAASIPLNT